MKRMYPDNRSSAVDHLAITDHGVVLHHGNGPDTCDIHGAREPVVYEEEGVFHLFYDGAGPKGWRACLATSRDLIHWEKKGPILELGAVGTPDMAAATAPWVIHDGSKWQMFYLGTPNASPAPDFVPAFPYLTLRASAQRLAGPWTKDYTSTPFSPKPGTWYSLITSPGYIIQHNGEFLQYFSGCCDQRPEDIERDGGRSRTIYVDGTSRTIIKRTLGLARTKTLDSAWTIEEEPIVPLAEQVENSSLYYEPANGFWFLFTNHVGCTARGEDGIDEFTDAIWVYWTRDPLRWDAGQKAVVLDGSSCRWSTRCVGMPSVVPYHGRLAVFYDAPGNESTSHMGRNIGLAWLELPLHPPTPSLLGTISR